MIQWPLAEHDGLMHLIWTWPHGFVLEHFIQAQPDRAGQQGLALSW